MSAIESLPPEVLYEIIAESAGHAALSLTSKHMRPLALEATLSRWRKDLKHWLKTEHGFLVCLVLYNAIDKYHAQHTSIESSHTTASSHLTHEHTKAHSDLGLAIAKAICAIKDMPLRFAICFGSTNHVHVLRLIVHALKK